MGRLWIAVLLVVVARLAPEIGRRGMHFDGLVYAAVSRNLAHGEGTAWAPRASETIFNPFYEHPPLFFWLESVPFHWSDSEWVEKCFSLATLLGALGLTFLLIDLLAPVDRATAIPLKGLAAVPWIASGLTAWVYANNVLETLLTLFALGAVIAFVAGERTSSRPAALAWGALGAVLVAAAVLTKGPTGLFPVAAPFLYVLATRPRAWAAGLRSSVLATLACGSLLGGVWLSVGAARDFASHYWAQQIVATVSGARGVDRTGASLVVLARALFHALWPVGVPFGVVLLLRWRARARRAFDRGLARAGAFLLLVGLSASLPLAITPIVRGHYLAPSTPFYAAGFACLGVAAWPFEGLSAFLHRLVVRAAAVALVVAVAVGFAVLFRDGPHPVRDRASQEMLDVCAREGLREERLDMSPALDRAWSLHAYLERHLGLSMVETARPTGAYYLVPSEQVRALPDAYQVPDENRTSRYALAVRAGGAGPHGAR